MPRVAPSNNDHLSRYCKPTAVGRDGLPTSAAFELRPNEEYLSVNWLEYVDSSSLETAVMRVRRAFIRKEYRLRRNGRFAVVGVGAARTAVKETVGRLGRVEHLPFDTDKSHAGLFGYTSDDLAVAVELRALVQCEDVYPALVDP